MEISIFHTNDMHCHLDAMARLGTVARQLREEAEAQGRHVFFWDAGDAADRSEIICNATKGAAIPSILAAMGCSLQTMGNALLLTYGPQAMSEVAARSPFPILAANCRDGGSPLLEGLQEFEIIPLNPKVSIGVIGLTTPLGDLYEVFDLHFPDFIQVAQRLVSRLRSEGVSLVTILSHLGLEEDRRLAEEVDGIDLIIGGHSHSRLDSGEVHNGVILAQAGQYAQTLGRVDLTLDPDTGKILSSRVQVLDIPADTPPDPAVLAAIAAAQQEVQELSSRAIGTLDSDLGHDFFQECDIGNLAADALRDRMKAEAALVTSGMLVQGLAGGLLSVGQLNAASFSTANPALSEVRGEQLLAALERGLDPTLTELKHHSYRGAPIGIPQISGMVVRFDSRAADAPRIRQVLVNGQPLEMDRTYRLAHTDAETLPELGYLELEEDQTIEMELPIILREVIAEYISKNSPLPVPRRGRWIPNE